ncbi:uncharacterized protein EDB91DRAFT_1111332 [Suillus paluster]|uniref:uncharacterized protein n=1 Tax=Suillus paluster TaxID=48578 RepID=UPI001B875E3C|nr:uncharacterized protein EDB91DRAFT_1111332 [Suillus paluster]KAG1748904.1 hypothetical protein EDB91DRAFT_1111332 [Suillus paluster]
MPISLSGKGQAAASYTSCRGVLDVFVDVSLQTPIMGRGQIAKLSVGSRRLRGVLDISRSVYERRSAWRDWSHGHELPSHRGGAGSSPIETSPFPYVNGINEYHRGSTGACPIHAAKHSSTGVSQAHPTVLLLLLLASQFVRWGHWPYVGHAMLLSGCTGCIFSYVTEIRPRPDCRSRVFAFKVLHCIGLGLGPTWTDLQTDTSWHHRGVLYV